MYMEMNKLALNIREALIDMIRGGHLFYDDHKISFKYELLKRNEFPFVKCFAGKLKHEAPASYEFIAQAVAHKMPWYEKCSFPVACYVTNNEEDFKHKFGQIQLVIDIQNGTHQFVTDKSAYKYAKPVEKKFFAEC